MKTRILAGLAMVPLLLLVYAGGYVLMAGCAIVTALAVNEFYGGFEKMGLKPSRPVAFGALILLYLIHILAPGKPGLILMWVIISAMASMIYIFDLEKRKLEDGLSTLVGIVYVELFFFHVVLTDECGYPIFKWLIFLIAFSADIFAYFTGYFFGKHKLAPVLSPKKTIEGAVGGLLGTAVLTVVVSAIFGFMSSPMVLGKILILGIVGAILSMLGDLTASAFKRKMDIKDYGNLIPGHGGIMDRFDSVLFTAPAVYYFVLLAFPS